MLLNRTLLLAAGVLLLATSATAQWSPPVGQWGKVDPADLRVMTFNVQDSICSSNAKVEGANDWCGTARLVAAFKPDVLLLQETGDNSGNGTGTGSDSVAALTATIDQFLHGGADTFHGGTPITAWVQKYAPGYDLPHVYVSTETDGFNRNCILSRFPFADLNGDGKSTIADIPTVSADAWAPGGDGQTRGFAFVEIDLPNATFAGNLVVGGAHLKAGSQSSDHNTRIKAAQNVSYVVQHWFNGNGGGVPDPNGKIADVPAATNVLDPNTPIVLGGDWNEDELGNGAVRGPADWLSQALAVGGTSDGCDRDGSDMTVDAALNHFTGSDASHSSGAKYDYVAWQDSIVALRHATIFISGSTPPAAQPPECLGFSGGPSGVTSNASDHRPVFADLRLPVVDCDGNGVADTTDILSGAVDANGNQIPDACECSAENYCLTSPNSVGPGAIIDSAGSISIAANNFHLQASGLPPGTAGLFFHGSSAVQAPFGNGWRCVGGATVRLQVLHADLLGTVHLQLDLAAAQIAPGTERRFQLWYRNPVAGGAGYNLSDGRRVRFCP